MQTEVRPHMARGRPRAVGRRPRSRLRAAGPL